MPLSTGQHNNLGRSYLDDDLIGEEVETGVRDHKAIFLKETIEPYPKIDMLAIQVVSEEVNA